MGRRPATSYRGEKELRRMAIRTTTPMLVLMVLALGAGRGFADKTQSEPTDEDAMEVNWHGTTLKVKKSGELFNELESLFKAASRGDGSEPSPPPQSPPLPIAPSVSLTTIVTVSG